MIFYPFRGIVKKNLVKNVENRKEQLIIINNNNSTTTTHTGLQIDAYGNIDWKSNSVTKERMHIMLIIEWICYLI